MPTIQAGQGNTYSNTLGISNLGNTSGTSGVISGAANQLVLAGGSNVTLSQSINGASATITISGASQSIQTNSIINAVSLSGVNTAGVLTDITSGTLYLAGGQRIKLSQSNNSITISADVGTYAIGMSTGGNTVGTTGFATSSGWRMNFVGGNNITLSQSINGASHTMTISGPTQTAESNTFGMSNIGNTSGTSGVVSGNQVQMVFAGGNNITLSQSINGSSATITISAASQSAASNSFGMSNLGNSAGTSGVASGNQIQMLIAGGNNITLSQSVNGASATVTINGGAGGAAGTNTFGISNLGNTAGTSGTINGSNAQLIFAGGNNITLSQSINGSSATITVSAAAQTAESNTFGASNLGNTSGTSGVVSGNQVQMVFAGGNNITLSQSLNGSSGTITISAGNAGAGSTFSEYINIPYAFLVAGNEASTIARAIGGASTTSFFALSLPYALNASVFNQIISINSANASNNNSTRGWSLSAYVGIYTRNDSTLSLLTSNSSAYTTTVSSQAWTSQGSATAQIMSIPLTMSVPAGLYYIAVAYLTSSTRTNIFTVANRIDYLPTGIGTNNNALSQGPFVAPNLWGAASTRNNNANGVGFITATNTTSISGSINISAIRTFAGGTAYLPVFHFHNGSVAQT